MLQEQKEISYLESKDGPIKIGLLGASFDTGNLGVSALADASIKLLRHRWSGCEIIFADSGYEPKIENIAFIAGKRGIANVPVRFSKNIFHKCHFARFFFNGVARNLGFKNTGNQYFKILNSCDLVCDIAGGDSFSDIYGLKRLFLGFLTKWLFIFLGKDFVMLPQTYGPFKKKISKMMAAYILKKAKAVYSRDKKGIECVCELLKGFNTEKVKLCPDVAFLLDSESWDDISVKQVIAARSEGKQIVGVNVSGLLCNGGYTQDNMFGLALDYPKLIKQILDYFLAIDDLVVVLVPHVFPQDDLLVESDPVACRVVYDSLTSQQQEKVILPATEPNQRQIKHLIGQCDFFMGARMHSCIAALSQCIPTVGMAYSDKFLGVFSTVGASDCVADMRFLSSVEMLDKVTLIFSKKEVINKHLKVASCNAKDEILKI